MRAFGPDAGRPNAESATALTVLRTSCPACHKPLGRHERYSGGFCADWICRHRRLEAERLRQREARIAALHREAVGDDPVARQAPVIRLPWYGADLAPIPAPARQALRDHLLSLQAEVSAMRAAPDRLALDAGAADSPRSNAPLDRLLGQVCADCGGRCCQQGADRQAFLDAGTMLKAWDRQPDTSYPELVQAYLARLPTLHHAGSCPYHGAQGCTLAREHRSATCNEWVCDGLGEVRSLGRDKRVRRVFIVRFDQHHPPQGRLVPPLPTR